MSSTDLVEKTISILRDRFGTDVGLRDVAHELAIDPFYLIRSFKKVTDLTPGRFLSAIRIAHAKHALYQTDKSVEFVATTSGYSSVSTFCRIFHAMVGLTPSQYRSDSRAGACDRFYMDALEFSAYHRKKSRNAAIQGVVECSDAPDGIIFVGSFRSAIPKGKPIAGAILLGPGAFTLPAYALQGSFLLAVRMPFDLNPYLPTIDQPFLRVGKHKLTGVPRPLVLHLDRLGHLDPPVVVALPSLFENSPAMP